MPNGLLDHHPMRIRSGIQKSVNWILRSMERASATVVGGSGTLKNCRRFVLIKYTTASVPFAEKDTNGRSTRPNHLRYKLS